MGEDALPLVMTVSDDEDEVMAADEDEQPSDDDFALADVSTSALNHAMLLADGEEQQAPAQRARKVGRGERLQAKLKERAVTTPAAPVSVTEEETRERKTKKAKAKAHTQAAAGLAASMASEADTAGGVPRDRGSGPKSATGGASSSSARATSFSELSLSMPFLKALSDLAFSQPTPIQSAVIPIALRGGDVCASAVTGSGKTAAFLLPALERLLYRPRRIAATRVLVLAPTRELAAQCVTMGERLAKHSDVRFSLIVGGLSSSVQEVELRSRPDVVVATPGRLIDLLRNSASIGLDDVEILVLDEADRLLELGFKDEVDEVVKSCPASRQTLLFSATISEGVSELAGASLNKPMQVKVDPVFNVAEKLAQEFVRIKAGKEHEREAVLLSLVTRTVRERAIVFTSSKKHAHRVRLLFGLFSLRVAELHGNLTQQQRGDSLEAFRLGEVDFLVATDLAGRGLDIPGVRTVINFNLPADMKTYVHRVGRTARAGLAGRAISLVGEGDRAFLKRVLKHASSTVQTRVVAQESISFWIEQISDVEGQVSDLLAEERDEKELRVAEMEANKASNLIEHHDRIMARPARSWFQTPSERAAAKESAWANPTAAAKRNDEEAEAKLLKSEPPKPKVKRDKYAGMSRLRRRALQRMEEFEKAAAEGDAQAEAAVRLASDKSTARSAKSAERRAPPQLGKRKAMAVAGDEKRQKKKKAQTSPAEPKAAAAVAPRARPDVSRKVRSGSKPKFTKARRRG